MKKIEIKKIKKSYAKDIAKILSDKEILKTLNPVHPYPVPESYIKDKISKDIKNWKTGQAYKFVITIDKKVAGQISLYRPNKNKKSYELGYFIGKDSWNKGIATIAVNEILKFGFKKLNLNEIISKVSINNPASYKVLKKTGFKIIKKTNKKFIFKKKK